MAQARAAVHELATALSVLSDRLSLLEACAAAVPAQIQEISDRLEELEDLVHFLFMTAQVPWILRTLASQCLNREHGLFRWTCRPWTELHGVWVIALQVMLASAGFCHTLCRLHCAQCRLFL